LRLPRISTTLRADERRREFVEARDFLRGHGLKNTMRTWSSYRRLPPGERRLARETAAALLGTRVGLRVGGLRRWKELLVRLAPLQPAGSWAGLPAQPEVEAAWRVAAIQEAVSRHLPWQASCLEKSLVLWWQLGRSGITAEMRIGARKEAGRFEAHAWVELGNVVLNDSGETHMHFAPFDGAILTLGS
jgi:Transglutaminase-like superfamily